MNTIYIKDKNEVDNHRKNLLNINKEIISENPHHNDGHEIVFRSKDIKDEFRVRLCEENILEISDNHIVCTGFNPMYRNPVYDILNDYNKEIISETYKDNIFSCNWK